MRINTHPQKQDGFTILELMIAMTISSLILAACAAGFVQVSRMYYRGIIQSKTQELTRGVIEDITRPIQFSGQEPIIHAPVNFGGVDVAAVCINDQRYSYAKGFQLSDTNNIPNKQLKHVLWQDATKDSTSCNPLDLSVDTPSDSNTDSAAFSARELMTPYTRISQLEIIATKTPNSPSLYQVTLSIIYGDEDLLVCQPSGGACTTPGSDPTTATCKGGILSSQFCAISSLSTVVSRRLK